MSAPRERYDDETEVEIARNSLVAVAQGIRILFGERCPEHAAGCHRCEMWAAHDRLVEGFTDQ